MSTFIETFCVTDRVLLNLPYHKERIEWTLGRPCSVSPFVEIVLAEADRLCATQGKWRATVTYSESGIGSVRLISYTPPQITSLKLIEITSNFYSKKWADRSQFDTLKESLPAGTEPILILNGELTDTTFTNILLEKDGILYTPPHPLLRGTKRSQLLSKGIATLSPISPTDLSQYECIHLINAMNDPRSIVLPISAIE